MMTGRRYAVLLATVSLSAAVLFGGAVAYAESRMSCSAVPAAVLSQAKHEAPAATVHGCVKDRENGKLIYEVETLEDNRSKDMTFDPTGHLLDVEEEVSEENLPPAVSSAILQAASGGRAGKVESVTRGGVIASYETTITIRGRQREVAFSPQGAPVQPD